MAFSVSTDVGAEAMLLLHDSEKNPSSLKLNVIWVLDFAQNQKI